MPRHFCISWGRVDAPWEQWVCPGKSGCARGHVAMRAPREGLRAGLREGLRAGLREGLRAGLRAGLREGLRAGLRAGLREGLREGLRAACRVPRLPSAGGGGGKHHVLTSIRIHSVFALHPPRTCLQNKWRTCAPCPPLGYTPALTVGRAMAETEAYSSEFVLQCNKMDEASAPASVFPTP
eukprot:351383-Chlamydomonas_euryale.AAC.2